MNRYRIKEFSIKEFNSYKYLGVKRTKVNSDHLLIYGEHKSGKSTTLDALSYALFGLKGTRRPVNNIAETCIIISNGAQEVKINRKSGTNHRLEIIDTKTKNTEIITDLDKINLKISKMLNLPDSDFFEFKAKLLYQDQESSLKKHDKNKIREIISYYTGFLDRNKEIDVIEKKLNAKTEEKEYTNIQIKELKNEINDQKLIISSSKDEIDYLKRLVDSYDNGSIKEIFEIKVKQKDVWNEIVKKQARNHHLNQEKKKLMSDKNDFQKYYDEKVLDLIKEIVSILICPVCGKRTNLTKIENKHYNKKCPYCGDDEYDAELNDKIRDKISVSKEKLPFIDSKLKDIDEERRINSTKIAELKSEFADLKLLLNPEIIRGVEDFKSFDDENFKTHIQNKREKLDKWTSELKEVHNEIERINNEIIKKKDYINMLLSEIGELKADKESTEKEILEKSINSFLEKLNFYYGHLMGYKKQPIIFKDGKFVLKMHLSGRKEELEDISSSKTIGESEKKCLDIALLLTFNDLDKENNASLINFLILDEPAEGLQNDSDLDAEVQILSNLLNLIKMKCDDDETQYIILTADKSYNEVLRLPTSRIKFNMDITRFS